MSWPDIQEMPVPINLRCVPFGSQPPVPSPGRLEKTVQIHVPFLFAWVSSSVLAPLVGADFGPGWAVSGV